MVYLIYSYGALRFPECELHVDILLCLFNVIADNYSRVIEDTGALYDLYTII